MGNAFFVFCSARPLLSAVQAVALESLAADYKLLVHLGVLVNCPLFVRRMQLLPEHSMQSLEVSLRFALLRSF